MASMDILLYSMPRNWYTEVLKTFAQRTYVLLDRENPIPSADQTQSVHGSSQHGPSNDSTRSSQTRGCEALRGDYASQHSPVAQWEAIATRLHQMSLNFTTKSTPMAIPATSLKLDDRCNQPREDVVSFPTFSKCIRRPTLPSKFKPLGITKYNGKARLDQMASVLLVVSTSSWQKWWCKSHPNWQNASYVLATPNFLMVSVGGCEMFLWKSKQHFPLTVEVKHLCQLIINNFHISKTTKSFGQE